MDGLSAKLSHVVDDWGEVGGTVELHLGQTLLVGLDHTFNAWFIHTEERRINPHWKRFHNTKAVFFFFLPAQNGFDGLKLMGNSWETCRNRKASGETTSAASIKDESYPEFTIPRSGTCIVGGI